VFGKVESGSKIEAAHSHSVYRSQLTAHRQSV
jgi:hypothetical protein